VINAITAFDAVPALNIHFDAIPDLSKSQFVRAHTNFYLLDLFPSPDAYRSAL